jgi:hypothetical protein
MQCYWAEIRLLEREILFHTERDLETKSLLEGVEKLRADFRKHQQPVYLSPLHVAKIEKAGVIALKKNFLALQGTWHWFSGTMNMDAFRFCCSGCGIPTQQPDLAAWRNPWDHLKQV